MGNFGANARHMRSSAMGSSNYPDTERPTFWMTDEQIAVSYRDAKDKIYQVRILAELNARSVRDTIAKLESLGIEIDRKRICARYGGLSRRDWRQDEIDKLFELKAKGYTYREIALELNRAKNAVENKYWRITNGEDKKWNARHI